MLRVSGQAGGVSGSYAFSDPRHRLSSKKRKQRDKRAAKGGTRGGKGVGRHAKGQMGRGGGGKHARGSKGKGGKRRPSGDASTSSER